LQEEIKLRSEIINLEAENERFQKQLEKKFKAIEKCIHEQAFEKLYNVNNQMLKKLDDYNRMVDKVNEEHQLKVSNLQNQLISNNRKKSSIVRDLGIALAPVIFSTILN
ncbi:31104_t:CDS:1, partial [Racocetra persica]